jgi:hypothetical protein
MNQCEPTENTNINRWIIRPTANKKDGYTENKKMDQQQVGR